jgi:hypothetical protein
MTSREREALDRHITGNYGEDQFREYDVVDMGPWEARTDATGKEVIVAQDTYTSQWHAWRRDGDPALGPDPDGRWGNGYTPNEAIEDLTEKEDLA